MKIQNIARLGGSLTGCDCDEILQRLTAAEEGIQDLKDNQWDCTKTEDCLNIRLTNIENNITAIQNNVTSIQNEITDIHTKLQTLEQFIMISEVSNYMAPSATTAPIQGIGVSAIRVGNTYNLWGTGSLTSAGSISLSGGSTYYLLQAGQPTDPNVPILDKMAELLWYVGDPTIGTLWIKDLNHSGGATFYSLPLQFDSTGIYFSVPSGNINNLTPTTTFRFTQALILAP